MDALYGLTLHFMAESASDPINLGILAQYGILGLVATGLFIFSKSSYKRETDRADRLEAEVTRLNNLIIDRAIPALTAAAQAAEDATRLIRDLQRIPPPRRPRGGGEDR